MSKLSKRDSAVQANNENSISKYFGGTSEYTWESRFIDLCIGVSDRIREIMSAKQIISKSEFAKLIDKKPSEVTKYLSGQHNFTLKTIAQIEKALGTSIVSRTTIIDDLPDSEVFKNTFQPSQSYSNSVQVKIEIPVSGIAPVIRLDVNKKSISIQRVNHSKSSILESIV